VLLNVMAATSARPPTTRLNDVRLIGHPMDIATFGNLYCNGDAATKQHESALIRVFSIAGVGLDR
jgi:hypothetical protein